MIISNVDEDWARREKYFKDVEDAIDFLGKLGITIVGTTIRAIDLRDLFLDKEKMTEIIAKLKMKTFW